jgi:hypothetical protein
MRVSLPLVLTIREGARGRMTGAQRMIVTARDLDAPSQKWAADPFDFLEEQTVHRSARGSVPCLCRSTRLWSVRAPVSPGGGVEDQVASAGEPAAGVAARRPARCHCPSTRPCRRSRAPCAPCTLPAPAHLRPLLYTDAPGAPRPTDARAARIHPYSLREFRDPDAHADPARARADELGEYELRMHTARLDALDHAFWAEVCRTVPACASRAHRRPADKQALRGREGGRARLAAALGERDRARAGALRLLRAVGCPGGREADAVRGLATPTHTRERRPRRACMVADIPGAVGDVVLGTSHTLSVQHA